MRSSLMTAVVFCLLPFVAFAQASIDDEEGDTGEERHEGERYSGDGERYTGEEERYTGEEGEQYTGEEGDEYTGEEGDTYTGEEGDEGRQYLEAADEEVVSYIETTTLELGSRSSRLSASEIVDLAIIAQKFSTLPEDARLVVEVTHCRKDWWKKRRSRKAQARLETVQQALVRYGLDWSQLDFEFDEYAAGHRWVSFEVRTPGSEYLSEEAGDSEEAEDSEEFAGEWESEGEGEEGSGDETSSEAYSEESGGETSSEAHSEESWEGSEEKSQAPAGERIEGEKEFLEALDELEAALSEYVPVADDPDTQEEKGSSGPYDDGTGESTEADDGEDLKKSLADLKAQMEAIVGEDKDEDTGATSDTSSHKTGGHGVGGNVLMGPDFDSSKQMLSERAAQFDPMWEKEGYHPEEDYFFVIGDGADAVDGEYLFQDGRKYLLYILCFGERHYRLTVSSDSVSESFDNKGNTDKSWGAVPGYSYGAHTLTVPFMWLMNLHISTTSPQNPDDGSKSMAIVKIYSKKSS